MREQQIQKRLDELQRYKERLLTQLDDVRKKHLIKCAGCTRGTQVRKLTLVKVYQQTTNYDEPLAESWLLSKYAIRCPKCEHVNQFNAGEHGQFSPHITQHEKYFNEVLHYRVPDRGSIGCHPIFRDSEVWNKEIGRYLDGWI